MKKYIFKKFEKFKIWFYSSLVYISLKQLHMMAIWVVLVFTIVFSLLLIQDESKSFKQRMKLEKIAYIEAQKSSLLIMLKRLKVLAEKEIADVRYTDAKLQMLVCLFSESEKNFIFIKTPKDYIICDKDVKSSVDINKIDFSLRDTFIDKKDALTYVVSLSQGYSLVAGILHGGSSERLFIKHQTEMKNRLIRTILEIATLAFILFGFILGINKVVNTLLTKDLDAFLKFFSHAAHSDKMMNSDLIFFKEFKHMVAYVNEMVETIVDQKVSLTNLNLSLEDKVKVKTKAVEDLLSSQKLFMRYAIHETNTPLSVIMANIELFEMNHGKNRHLSKIEAAMKNIYVIVDDLSYLVTKDQIDYAKHTLSLLTFLRSRIEFFEEIAIQGHLSFDFICEIDDFTLYMNETKLQRIIDNNLSNAIKYTHKGETITIKLYEQSGQAFLSFCSRSEYIHEPDKVFEAYYRESEYAQGFGLGLNLVKRICDEESVKIELDSNVMQTCFTYIFKGAVYEDTLT